jgi:geranylgeranyl diphosphate synthase type I
MFTLAHLTLFRLQETTSLETAFRAAVILQETCLQLTQGQHLDISYEERDRLDLQAYWAMVGGKTAALLAACTELGALIARVDPNIQAAYREFGLSLGLAFQAQDDLLGIWGDSEMLGKSTASDLYSGKKSLPVLYGLSYGGAFARRWRQGPIKIEEVSQMAQLLEQEGAKGDTQEQVLMYTNKALSALEQACPLGQAGDALISLTNKLLIRRT